MIGLESVLRRSDQVRYRWVEDEAVIILQTAGEALVLNEVGARILDLLDGETPISGCVDQLMEEYEVERSFLEKDVLEFLTDLCQMGVTEVASSP